MAKLPVRPQWFRETIAALRAQRKRGDIPDAEFAELAADEIEDHPEYLRSLAVADARKYDRAVTIEQAAQFTDEMATVAAKGYIQPSLHPEEVLEKLGLDRMLDLGYGRKVDTADATHEERQKAIAELERKKKSWETSVDKDIAAIEALDELAGNKTLREIIAEPPQIEETGE